MTAKTRPTPPDLHRQGVSLLEDYLDVLQHHGYRKAAIDTWRNDTTRHNLRHRYVNGEWAILYWHDGLRHSGEVRWSTRATMPTTSQLLHDTQVTGPL